jgi:hypothetical protein
MQTIWGILSAASFAVAPAKPLQVTNANQENGSTGRRNLLSVPG